MPEGPSIVILREEAAKFEGRTIRRAEGSAPIDMARLRGLRVRAVRSFGKQFLIGLPDCTLRIHLLLFGRYLIDTHRTTEPRLGLRFDRGELNFYACSARLLEGELDTLCDWRIDVMSEAWDPALALRTLRARPGTLACDALLDQAVFAGVGNIIKNEVLYRIGVHPLSTVGALPPAKLRQLVAQARQYSFEFLAWKRAGTLRAHWLVHQQALCPRHRIPLHVAELGRSRRRAFFCERCQRRYGPPPAQEELAMPRGR
jgi:endonuclease-8